MGGMRAVPRLGELYPGICLTTEEKAWKNLTSLSSQHNLVHKKGLCMDKPNTIHVIWSVTYCEHEAVG